MLIKISPPVGKSGPGMSSNSFSSLKDGFFIIAIRIVYIMKDIYHNTIVKIIATNLIHDWYAPFRNPYENTSIGTGVFFDKGLIFSTILLPRFTLTPDLR